MYFKFQSKELIKARIGRQTCFTSRTITKNNIKQKRSSTLQSEEKNVNLPPIPQFVGFNRYLRVRIPVTIPVQGMVLVALHTVNHSKFLLCVHKSLNNVFSLIFYTKKQTKKINNNGYIFECFPFASFSINKTSSTKPERPLFHTYILF